MGRGRGARGDTQSLPERRPARSGGVVADTVACVADRRISVDDRHRRIARSQESADIPGDVRVEHRAEAVLRKVIVAEALGSLSPAHREVLHETVLRNRTVNEAANVLGVPVATVKSRVYYALRALRIVLDERGVTA